MSADARAREEFAALVRLVADPVSAYLMRRTDTATADDVLAETLVVLWRRLADVPREAEIPWAIGIARLQLKNAQRARRRGDALADRVAAMDPPAHADPADAGGPDGDDPDVTAAIRSLRPADGEILRLWAWEELSPVEIAAALGITTNAASIRLHRAKRRFAVEYRKRRPTSGQNETGEGGTA